MYKLGLDCHIYLAITVFFSDKRHFLQFHKTTTIGKTTKLYNKLQFKNYLKIISALGPSDFSLVSADIFVN